jgi:hypothetical protein
MMIRRHVIAAAGGLVVATAGGLAQTVSPARSNGTMEIKRSGSQPSRKGPAEYFTGAVRVDPLFQAGDPARVSGGQVTFEPGARTAWHTHPLGQTHHLRPGVGAARGRSDRRGPARRRGLVSGRIEALAWGDAHDSDDAHRHH